MAESPPPSPASRPAPSEEGVRATGAWVVDEALAGIRLDLLLEGFCERLVGLGVRLGRGNMGFGWLHPMFGAMAITWTPEEGLIRDRFVRGGSKEVWNKSAPKAMIDEQITYRRYRLEIGEGLNRFEQLQRLADNGYTDYVMMLAPFTRGDPGYERGDGMFCSWTCDAPGGFTEAELATLDRLFPRLALAIKAIIREETARNVLSAYLGSGAGQRVLDGFIQLGDGERISAVLWYSDLRGSTPLADSLPEPAFLDHLNRYFACSAGAVLDHGGEVLRFIGDAVLAIFPTDGTGGAERAARLAVAAAQDACARVDRTNAERADDVPEIAFGLALHVGEVMYGNIGVPERLEFSVIGRAANEVARLEGLSKTLGHRVLASDALRAIAPTSAQWENLGPQHFRGVQRPQTVWALSQAEAS